MAALGDGHGELDARNHFSTVRQLSHNAPRLILLLMKDRPSSALWRPGHVSLVRCASPVGMD